MPISDLYQMAKSTIVEAHEICYIDQGDGEQVLLFLHGMGSSLKAWSKNIPFLSSSFRCIALDVPGFGRSPKKINPTDVQHLSRIVTSFIEQLELSQVVLVGHSMGGLMSILIADQNPELISKLILIAPAGIEAYSKEESELIKTYFTAELLASYGPAFIRKNFKLNFYKMPDDANFMIEERIIRAKDKEKHFSFSQTMADTSYSISINNVKDALGQIQKPVLILFGDKDKLIPHHIMHPDRTTEMIAQKAIQLSKAGQLKMYNNCGHFVHWERSDEVNQEITNFMAS